MPQSLSDLAPTNTAIYPDGYIGLFYELPNNPEEDRWRWELWKEGVQLDEEYAPDLRTCQRECPAYVRIHHYVAARDKDKVA